MRGARSTAPSDPPRRCPASSTEWGRVPVLFDSGVRSGADVFRALALGASGVMVGRPYAYGLAIAGAAGAEAVLRNIVAEFDLVLGLSGHRSVAELGRDALA